MFKLLSAIGAYEHNPTATFCTEYFLRLKAMQEIQQLRSQISNIAGSPLRRMEPPDDKQVGHGDSTGFVVSLLTQLSARLSGRS
jgi:ATP-dependent RNA helicase DHX37/DHR1